MGGALLLGAVFFTGALVMLVTSKGVPAGGQIGVVRVKSIDSAEYDDDEEEDDEADGRVHKTSPHSTALTVVSTALVTKVQSASRNKLPVKAFVEAQGDVHTIRVPNVHAIERVADLRMLLVDACTMSGAPELAQVDLGAASIQYLTDGNAPSMVTEMTCLDALRAARAFRVILDPSL